MASISINKPLFVVLILLFALYLAWSLFTLYNYHNKIKSTQQRVYNIADNFELFKTIHRNANGKFNLNFLANDQRNIEISEVTRQEALSVIKPGQKLYTMFYSDPDTARKQQLERYFSKRVLNNYFYVVTDSNGKIVEMFWDKP